MARVKIDHERTTETIPVDANHPRASFRAYMETYADRSERRRRSHEPAAHRATTTMAECFLKALKGED